MKNKAYRYRIYPNQDQQVLFSKTFGCARFLYNRMLADKIAYYEANKAMLRNTPAQYKKQFEWLKEVDSLALCNAQLHLEAAYTKFFHEPKTGFPKFKSKHHSRASYTTNMVNGNIRITGGKLHLPKAGDIRIRLHREIPDGYRIKSVTVTREPDGKYYASILCVCETQVQPARQEKKTQAGYRALGLDFSMGKLYAASDGTSAEYPRYYRKSEAKLAREQRKLSHMQKGSRNREKQRLKVAKVHARIRNQRKDFQHKLTGRIANDWDVVCVEDLNLKGMEQGMHFGKSVTDAGYHAFLEKLSYKMEERGKPLVYVDRFYASSQICSVCGHKNPATKDLRIRKWTCPLCGAEHDRDINAAINIREEGMRKLLQESA